MSGEVRSRRRGRTQPKEPSCARRRSGRQVRDGPRQSREPPIATMSALEDRRAARPRPHLARPPPAPFATRGAAVDAAGARASRGGGGGRDGVQLTMVERHSHWGNVCRSWRNDAEAHTRKMTSLRARGPEARGKRGQARAPRLSLLVSPNSASPQRPQGMWQLGASTA